MPRAWETQLYKAIQPILHSGTAVPWDGHNASAHDLQPHLSRPLLMGCCHPPLPDSLWDSLQAIISAYHPPSLAMVLQLLSIQKKIAPFILSFTVLFTFIHCSAAFLIRYLKISQSTSDEWPCSFFSSLWVSPWQTQYHFISLQASNPFHYSFPLIKWDNGCERVYSTKKRYINTSSSLLLLFLYLTTSQVQFIVAKC